MDPILAPVLGPTTIRDTVGSFIAMNGGDVWHNITVRDDEEYVKEFTASRAIGSDGYLVSKGLIPLSDSERTKFEKDGKTLAKFDVKVLNK